MLDFDVTVSDQDGRAVVAVAGELDIATAPALRAALDQAAGAGRSVVVDLSPTTFADSTGISTLAQAHARAKAAGRRMIVICPRANRDVGRILELIGLDQILDIRESLEGLVPPD